MSEFISASSDSGISAIRILSKSVKFTIVSYLVSVLLLAVLTVVIVYTDVPEKISGPSVIAIKMFGAFLSAFLTSKSCETKGWLCGIVSGVVNILLLMVIGSLISNSHTPVSDNLTNLLFGGACGMIGGIIGVNFVKN